MFPSDPLDPRHTQLRTWYDQLTARIAAANKDIGRALSELDRQIHRERVADLTADREIVTAYLDALEKDQPLPGPCPPEFQTTDLLAAPSPRIHFKSGRCDFYRHIPRPPNYIPRPKLLTDVRERLLRGTGGLALTSAIQVKQADVLHGMGGIGKSVLARALCEDPDVQAAFPDGILWATLGQTPDLTARMREWIETLGGVVGQTAPTLDQLRNTLAEALKDKACLLIVDDAWQKAHLEPFCAGGPACRLLITTRDAALAEGLDAGVYPVPVMAPDEAIALLEEWAQGSLAEVEAEVKVRIVRRLGCLPLAVRLAGAQLRGKDPVEWLASFDARRLRSRRVETVHDSLAGTFGLSLDALDPADRRLYVALAIFKEDEATPVVAVAKLWGALDNRKVSEINELLADLADRALLARSRGDGDAITLHDLLRDFMVTESGEEGRVAAHRALLAAYRQTCQEDGWHTAPDDGYLYDHLAYHLDALAAGDLSIATELTDLFANENWLHCRVAHANGLYNGYVADLLLVWGRDCITASAHIEDDLAIQLMPRCVRYALIRTSINSRATNCEPVLVAYAIKTGLWSLDRAISVVRWIPSPVRRATMFAELLKTGHLQTHSRLQAEEDSMTAVKTIKDERLQAKTLTVLAPQLTGETLQGAFEAVLGIRHEAVKAKALAALASRLTGRNMERCLEAALAIVGDREKTEVLYALAPQLPGELLTKALKSGLAHRLAPCLTGTAQAQALEMGIREAQSTTYEPSRAAKLAALAHLLTGERLLQGLNMALTMTQEDQGARVLAALAPQLSGDLLEKALAAALKMENEQAKGEALAGLASRLTGDMLQHGLDAALTMKQAWPRARSLASLAPQLVGTARAQVAETGLRSAQAIEDVELRVQALAALIPHLTGQMLERGLSAALGIRSTKAKIQLLRAIAPYLTGKFLQRGLTTALRIRDESYRAQALLALVPHLTDRLLRRAFSAALTLRNETARAEVLATLMPLVPNDLVRPGLAAVLQIRDETVRTKALVAFAPHLTGDALQYGLAEAQAIRDARARERALTVLHPTLGGRIGLLVTRCSAILSPALSAMRPRPRWWTQGCRLLDAEAMGDGYDRVYALAALMPRLTGRGFQAEALQVTMNTLPTISDEESRAEALCVVAPWLPEESLERMLVMAQAMVDGEARARALSALAPKLQKTAQERAIEAGMAGARTIENEGSRAKALMFFLPLVHDSRALQCLVRQAMIDHLWKNLAHEERETLLWFCADSVQITPSILPPAALAAIAHHIIEICQEWEWL